MMRDFKLLNEYHGCRCTRKTAQEIEASGRMTRLRPTHPGQLQPAHPWASTCWLLCSELPKRRQDCLRSDPAWTQIHSLSTSTTQAIQAQPSSSTMSALFSPPCKIVLLALMGPVQACLPCPSQAIKSHGHEVPSLVTPCALPDSLCPILVRLTGPLSETAFWQGV